MNKFEQPLANIEAQEIKDEARRRKENPDQGLAPGRGPNLSPTDYAERTDDVENDEFINANDKEKFIPIQEVGDIDVAEMDESKDEEGESNDIESNKYESIIKPEVDEFKLDDNEGKIASAHFSSEEDEDTLLVARENVSGAVGPLKTDIIEELNEAKIDKLDELPKSDSSGKVKANIYHVKTDGGHYKGGHYPSKKEKSETELMQKTRRAGKEEHPEYSEYFED